MKVAARQSRAQILEVDLQKHLQAAGFKNLPLYLSCDFREASLTVVGEHPRSLVLKAKETFAVLEAAILELQPESIQQIGLCLKITGQKQPYAFHSFTMNHPVLSRKRTVEVGKTREEIPAEVTESKASNLANIPDAVADLPLDIDATDPGFEETFPDVWETSSDAEPIAFQVSSIPTDIAENPFDPLDMEPVTVAPKPKQSPFLGLAVAGIASLAIGVFGGVYYLLSRPCAIGQCTALADAKQLSDNSARTLKTSKVASSPETAQTQLKQAIALLTPIPFWSIHHGKAQDDINKYRSQSQDLTFAVDAARLAVSATETTENPPHSAENWQEAQSLWQSAIAKLEEIPRNSPAYPFAQKKLKEYQTKLARGNRQLTTETKAEKKLRSAKSTAQVAEARAIIAQKAESWDKVEANLQKSLDTLSEIPSSTESYQQAKVLVPKYESKLSQARDRKTVEGTAEEAYTQAVTIAAQARIFEDRNAWFQASEHWRRALSSAEKVPSTTAYYSKTKSLMPSYRTSLQQAEVKLEEQRTLQKARTDLDRTCKGNPKICDFTVSKDLIAVQMTPDYVQKLQQTFIQAENTNATKTRQAVEKHVETLQKALEAIADNAKIPMQVYDSEGKRIATQTPN
jgi:tetratricopeptide (TPR) repeat protein